MSRVKAVAMLFLFLLLLNACQDSNQELYDEVMAIHDEVMPKMDDLYKRKVSLQARLSNPETDDSEKRSIERSIAQIDSASEGMMAWMRQFNPVADSEGEEKARAYLEDQLEKVKKVRADILEALDNPAD